MIYFKNFLFQQTPCTHSKVSLPHCAVCAQTLEASGQCNRESRAQSRLYPRQSIPCKPDVPDCRSAKSFPLHFPQKEERKKKTSCENIAPSPPTFLLELWGCSAWAHGQRLQMPINLSCFMGSYKCWREIHNAETPMGCDCPGNDRPWDSERNKVGTGILALCIRLWPAM